MGCDVVVALGQATVDGHTLLAHNSDRPLGECQSLCLVPGRAHALGEKTRTQWLELPQARQTYRVLGHQPAGLWGFSHGVNEHAVALGHVPLRSKLLSARPGLTGTDLVRLGLERSRSARQAVDLLTELVERHGQGSYPGCPPHAEGDAGLLVADPQEAYVLECAGSFWVTQQVQQVRAMSNVSVVRQDWDRISPGLAGYAIQQGWWPGDGSKLDFAGAVSSDPIGTESALRRWGRATLLLEQQSGHIDDAFLRHVLSDHYEGMQSEVDPLHPGARPTPLCQHGSGPSSNATVASMVVQLGGDSSNPVAAWCSFGSPCLGISFPMFLDGDLPGPFTTNTPEAGSASFWWRIHQLNQELAQNPERWAQAQASLGFLQARIDQETDEFLVEAAALRKRGAQADFQRLAGIFMQHNLEQFETVRESLLSSAPSTSSSGMGILNAPATGPWS